MSDSIGRITVPAPVLSTGGTTIVISGNSIAPISSTQVFPFLSDFGYAFTQDRPVVVHTFGELDAKAEQCFQTGIGPARYAFLRDKISYSDRTALNAFWESMQGAWKAFTYAVPSRDKRTLTPTLVNFEYAPLSLSHLVNGCKTGMTFVAAYDPTTAPSYTVSSTVTRFPSSGLSTALLSQVQQIIPLIHIKVRDGAVPDIYLSDQRCTVGGQLYQARLQDINEPGSSVIISQNINGQADNVQFTFGNADRVMTSLSNDTDLRLASIDLSLYHVQSQILLQLWKGFIVDFVNDGSPSFSIRCSDGLYQVMQQYPLRTIDRQCAWTYNDGLNCPWSTVGASSAAVIAKGGDPASCDFFFNSANGCQVHGGTTPNPTNLTNIQLPTSSISAMTTFFGAHPVQPQSVAGIAQIVGGLRNFPTSTSIVSDTVWGTVLQEIYCNDGGNALYAFQAPCAIVAGRRETNNNGDPQFYDALGIVGAGPIGLYSGTNPANGTDGWYVFTANTDGLYLTIGPLLDGFTAHGFRLNSNNTIHTSSGLGIRCVHGNQPEINPFCLTQIASPALTGSYSGIGGDNGSRASGTAFMELRRVDADQSPSLTEQHQMTASISQGLAGYTWDSGGTRSLTSGLTNPFWIVVNCLLRSTGNFTASSSAQLALFDLPSLAAGGTGTADIANLTVNSLVGGGTETQFQFQGTLNVQKPLRDWFTEILSCCLGYFTFNFGKLSLGVRENASATDAFTLGNILFQSLRLQPINAQFERIIITFADRAYQFQQNTATYVDKTHASYMGRANAPLTARLNCVGGANLSQMLRIGATRVREEIGGVDAAEWAAARMGTWKTTILALSTGIGQVVSMTHADMPGGSGKFRIQSWRLMKDWSIEITGRTVTDSMYDLTVGPKPIDVTPPPLPGTWYPLPAAPALAPYQVSAASNDALFPNEFSFGSDQEYTTKADGSPSCYLIVTTKLPVTSFAANSPAPSIGSVSQSTTGGSIPGGSAVTVTIASIDGNGLVSPSAQIQVINVPSGTNTNTITLSNIAWPRVTGLSYGVVFDSGTRGLPELITEQSSVTLSPTSDTTVYTPDTLTITSLSPAQWSLPNPYTTAVRFKAKILAHSGVVGVGVTSVSANTIVSSDMVATSGSPINFAGRVISVIGRPIGLTPFASFTITVHNPATGTFTVTPDPNGIVQALDAIVIRNKADAPNTAPYTTITDSGYENSVNAYGGLTVNAEVGNVMRVIQGTGRGQLRKILSNTATSLTFDQPLQLDTTSVWIIEEAAWVWSADISCANNADWNKSTSVSVAADNLLQQPVLIAGFTIDQNGAESPDGNCPIREDWVFGAQGTRDINASDASTDMLATDGLVRFHTDVGGGDITYHCLPFATLPNRLFIWQRDSASDGHNVFIVAATGDAFDAAGTTTLTLTDNTSGTTGQIVFKVYG